MASPKRLVSFKELSKHSKPDDIWIVVDGKVYNMTNFAPKHPGGDQIIYNYAARDASSEYAEIHPPSLIMESLPQSDHIGNFDASTAPSEWNKESQTQAVDKAAPDEKAPLATIINLFDFEENAEIGLSKKNWAFISGASNDNLTRDANMNYYQKIWFRPRILRNVRQVDTRWKMLGQEVSLPIWIAPAGLGKTGGPEGEIALSSGAAATGIIQVISTNASFPLNDILKAAPPEQPFFFQLYVEKEREKTEKLLRQINAAPQIKAIFLTVDLPVVSKREGDERIKLENVQTSSLSGSKSFSDMKGAGLARSVGSFIDPSLSWDDVDWIRKHTKLPLILKGVQSAADARAAMEIGCQGIVVSNHGGRALDNAPASILVLLELRRDCPEVFEHMEIFIDGGVRRGSDVLKALCLGASGVGFGRTFMYALNYGREGVEHAVNIIKDELETAMRLSGIRNLKEAGPSFLNTAELDVLLPPGVGNPFAREKSRL